MSMTIKHTELISCSASKALICCVHSFYWLHHINICKAVSCKQGSFFKSLAHTANVLCSDSNLLKGSLMRDLNLSALTLITSCAGFGHLVHVPCHSQMHMRRWGSRQREDNLQLLSTQSSAQVPNRQQDGWLSSSLHRFLHISISLGTLVTSLWDYWPTLIYLPCNGPESEATPPPSLISFTTSGYVSSRAGQHEVGC